MASSNTANKFDAFIDEKYIPLSAKAKAVIVVLAVLVPVALFYFLYYKDEARTIQGLNKQITSARKDLNRARKAARNLPRYKAEIEKTRKKFAEAAVVLPKTKEIPNLLRSISDLGKGAGLDFLSFKPGKEAPKDFYAEIPVDISIRGPYHNMGFFLDQVSKLDRIVTVNNISMGSPKMEGGEMLLKSKCRLVTYRFTNTKASQNTAKNKKKKRKR
jgi:type IV pilus assembly protein PilO